MSDGKSMTADQVAAKIKNNRLRMTEAEAKYINPKGHRIYHESHHIDEQTGDVSIQEHSGPRSDGYYKWANSYVPNINGELTPIAKAVNSATARFNQAEHERHSENQARIGRVALNSENGVQYVLPDKADETAQRNGWRHRFRGRATRRFVGGVWYVRCGAEWIKEG